MSDSDKWLTLHQKLPESVYDAFFVHLGRIALANGIAPAHLFEDDKFKEAIGPRVLAYELLTQILARMTAEQFRV